MKEGRNVSMYECTYLHACTHVRMYASNCKCTCIYARIHVFVYVCICMYVRMYAYMHGSLYVWAFPYTLTLGVLWEQSLLKLLGTLTKKDQATNPGVHT